MTWRPSTAIVAMESQDVGPGATCPTLALSHTSRERVTTHDTIVSACTLTITMLGPIYRVRVGLGTVLREGRKLPGLSHAHPRRAVALCAVISLALVVGSVCVAIAFPIATGKHNHW